MAETRTCLECETKLRGRADQKFCSDQCRNAYNNARNSDANHYMRNTNNSLRKNRRILEEVLSNKKDGKGIVNLKTLSKLGFNFDLMTSIYTTKSGNVYYFCYEYGYQKLEDEKYMVVQREL
jgi:hypothetical protein